MKTPSDLERFLGYARDFELAYLTDDWSRLLPWFSADALHHVEDGGPFGHGASGREAVVANLRASVARVDRRFDVRIPEIVAGARSGPDGIDMRFALSYRCEGLPDLDVAGSHRAVFEDGVIQSLHERLEPGTGARVAHYLEAHDAFLRPEGAAFAPPRAARDLEHLAAATSRTLLRSYGAAKSEADVAAALALCSDDFVLDAVSLGLASNGRAETEAMLVGFFRGFPDYAVTLDGFATGAGTVTAWGRARMSLLGEWLGLGPTGKTAELPVFCVLGVANGKLTSERFFFDRATLCEQLGVSADALAATLRALHAGGR
jgi:predicted ester cyclase